MSSAFSLPLANLSRNSYSSAIFGYLSSWRSCSSTHVKEHSKTLHPFADNGLLHVQTDGLVSLDAHRVLVASAVSVEHATLATVSLS